MERAQEVTKQMTYRVEEVPDCVLVDTSTKLDARACTALAASTWNGRSVRGAVRYISIHNEARGDIDAVEVAAILEAGLGFMAVQHVRYPGWSATDTQGGIDGAAAAINAHGAGYLTGCTLWLDLEGVRNVGTEVVAYVNAWANAVAAAGYMPGLYVGYACGLSPYELYYDLPGIHVYWSDAGPRAVADRGFAMKQHAQTVIAGVQVDPDTATADAMGGRPRWMIAEAA